MFGTNAAKTAVTAVAIAFGNKSSNGNATLWSLKYLEANSRLKRIRKPMLTQFAKTSPLAPICITWRKSQVLPANMMEKKAIHLLCRRSSVGEAAADTKASLTPLIAKSGME